MSHILSGVVVQAKAYFIKTVIQERKSALFVRWRVTMNFTSNTENYLHCCEKGIFLLLALYRITKLMTAWKYK